MEILNKENHVMQISLNGNFGYTTVTLTSRNRNRLPYSVSYTNQTSKNQKNQNLKNQKSKILKKKMALLVQTVHRRKDRGKKI